jgi:hypothetical protein
MANIRSDELRHPPAARDTKSSSGETTIIIRSLNKYTITQKNEVSPNIVSTSSQINILENLKCEN